MIKFSKIINRFEALQKSECGLKAGESSDPVMENRLLNKGNEYIYKN